MNDEKDGVKLVLADGYEIPLDKVFIANIPKSAIIILEHPATLSFNVIQNIEEIIGDKTGHKCVVLTEGMTINCIIKNEL